MGPQTLRHYIVKFLKILKYDIWLIFVGDALYEKLHEEYRTHSGKWHFVISSLIDRNCFGQ